MTVFPRNPERDGCEFWLDRLNGTAGIIFFSYLAVEKLFKFFFLWALKNEEENVYTADVTDTQVGCQIDKMD